MSPARLARLESGMRIVIEFSEAFNRHDVAGMVQLLSEDCTVENSFPAPDGTVYSGREAVTRFWQDFFEQSPHARIEIEELFGLGYRCVMRWRHNRTDSTGKEAHIRGVNIFELKNNSIYKIFSYVKG